jgi:hypothetical protein
MSCKDSELLPFTYSPIHPGSIQLLVFSPLGKCGGHSWTLQVASVSGLDVSFDSLSYVWGLQTELLPITLIGKLLHVHHNLHSAFPYLA